MTTTENQAKYGEFMATKRGCGKVSLPKTHEIRGRVFPVVFSV